jgi:adenosine/AMP kinase
MSSGRKLELEVVDIENPKEYNFILGHGEVGVLSLK